MFSGHNRIHLEITNRNAWKIYKYLKLNYTLLSYVRIKDEITKDIFKYFD